MLTLDREAALLTATTAPDGWWQVDWPDGRRTSFRSQDDALQLARKIGADLPRRTTTL